MRIATPCAAVLFLAGCALVFFAAGCSTQSIRKDQAPPVDVVEDDPVVIASIGFGRPGMTFPQPLRLSDFYGWPLSSWAGHSVAEYLDSLEDERLKALIRREIGEHYFEPVDPALYDYRCFLCASQEEVGDRVFGPEVPVEAEPESQGDRCIRHWRAIPTISDITKRGIMSYTFEVPYYRGEPMQSMLSHLYLGDGAPTGHAPEDAARPQEQPVPVETIEAAGGGVPTRPDASVIVEGSPPRVRRNIHDYIGMEYQTMASPEDLGFVPDSWRDFQ